MIKGHQGAALIHVVPEIARKTALEEKQMESDNDKHVTINISIRTIEQTRWTRNASLLAHTTSQ